MFPFKVLPHYSYKTVWLASVLLAAFWGLGSAALAANPYSVDNVTVDATGSDTTDARNKALSAGEVDAFKQLITQLDPAHATTLIAKTSHPQISMMVRGYQVIDEKMTSDHYHATLRYSFDPKQIQALTNASPAANPPAAGEPAVAAAAEARPAPVAPPPPDHPRKAVLVLPVYNEGNALKLWQDDNKWRSVWYDAALESGSGLVVAPLGDLDDRVDVDNTNVSNATSQSLARMYGRYGVGEIDVMSAFFNKKADPKPTLEVTIKRLTPTKEETFRTNYTILSTETPDTLMVRASNDIARATYLRQTIDPNKIEYDRLKEINARINTSDIKEWETLRKRLLAHGNIVGIKYNSISFYETTMTITFKGTPDMLGKTLVAAGLRVMQDGDDLVLALK